MTVTPLRLLGSSALALALASVAGAAHADIANFTFVGIDGIGDLDGKLDDRLGITNNASEHIINIDDCGTYEGGDVQITVRISPLPTGSWQYAIAYAPPGKTCSTNDANPEAVDGQCYVPAAQRELTSTSIDFDVSMDDLIGSACDAGTEGDATLYVILQNSSTSTVSYETVIFNVDLRAPAAPTLSDVVSGDARFTAKWTDDTNTSEDDLEYILYWSDAPFSEDDLDSVDHKSSITAKTVSIESGLDNDVTYYVSVAARDHADNLSTLSNQIEVTPAATTDFWEAYVGAGGRDSGCGAGSGDAGVLALVGAGALVVVGRRRRAVGEAKGDAQGDGR